MHNKGCCLIAKFVYSIYIQFLNVKYIRIRSQVRNQVRLQHTNGRNNNLECIWVEKRTILARNFVICKGTLYRTLRVP